MFRVGKNLLLGCVRISLLLPLTAMADDAYINGHWYDGDGFVQRDVYVIDGRIRFKSPDRIDNTVDLAGAYVIPPFGEAHNHDFTTDFEPQDRIGEYLADGVYYAKMQSAFSNGFDVSSFADRNYPGKTSVFQEILDYS